MKKQRIAAIIGCGKHVEGSKEGWAIGHAHASAYREADPGVRLIGVDVDAGNLRAFGERFGIPGDDLFSSTEALYSAVTPDYASICTWPKLHAPQVIEAAARGVRGIVCEKPMALNGAEIDTMLAACERTGARLAVAHQRCFGANFKLARKLLNEGAIGVNWVLEARVGDGWDMLSWSVHWFDLTGWLFDAAPLSVMAGIDHTGGRRYQHAVENGSVVFTEYPGKRQAIFVTGPDNHQQGDGEVYIRGSDGMMRISDKVEVWNRDAGYRSHTPDAGAPAGFIGIFAALMSDLFSAVEEGRGMECDAKRCAISTRTAFAAHESARLMRRIEAPFATGYAPLEVVQHPPRPALPAGRLVLFADEHFGSGGREGILDALRMTTGEAPSLVEADKGLTSADLEGAGALLIYHTQSKADAVTKSVLTKWVESGKPTVFVHAAVGAYPDWEQYKRWACNAWVWGPQGSEHLYEECTLHAVSSQFRAWESAWLPTDEVFIKLETTGDPEILVEAKIPSGVFPAGWRSREFPNIVTWLPGHRREMWSIPALRQGLVSMIQLAAGSAMEH